jgi:cell division FtsZ-interacting protein ZapD
LLRVLASNGVYHLTLERDVPAQMIRILLPQGTDMYPEISGSHYRVSVRFLSWQDANTHPVQMTGDVPFLLALCT